MWKEIGGKIKMHILENVHGQKLIRLSLWARKKTSTLNENSLAVQPLSKDVDGANLWKFAYQTLCPAAIPSESHQMWGINPSWPATARRGGGFLLMHTKLKGFSLRKLIRDKLFSPSHPSFVHLSNIFSHSEAQQSQINCCLLFQTVIQ